MFLNYWKVFHVEVKGERRFCCFRAQPSRSARPWAGAAAPLSAAAAPQGRRAAGAAPLISALLTPSRVAELAARKQCSAENLKENKRKVPSAECLRGFLKCINTFICWIFYFASMEL